MIRAATRASSSSLLGRAWETFGCSSFASGQLERRGSATGRIVGETQPELVETYLSEELMSGQDLKRLTLRNKASDFQRHEQDTGSTEVQVARLNERIHILSSHLQKFRKDMHGKRSIHVLLSQRTKLLKYLHRKDPKTYFEILARLGLRDRPFSEPKYPSKR